MMYHFTKNIEKGWRSILFIFPLMLWASISSGQSNFTEGKITYSVDVIDPGTLSQQAIKSLENGELIFNFKNQLFRSYMKMGNTEHINIHDSENHSGLSLIKAGNGKNYMIKMDQNDLRQEAEKYQGMHYTSTDETKKIEGYLCHKAVATLKDGDQFAVYYTKQLKPLNKHYDPRFEGIDGLPLQFQFNVKSANAKLTLTATDVETGFQPSSLFKTPNSGYRVLTYEQLKKLREGRK